MLNNVVGYCRAYIRGTYIWGAYIRVGLYSGGLIFGGGAYIRGGGGLIVGGLRYLLFCSKTGCNQFQCFPVVFN